MASVTAVVSANGGIAETVDEGLHVLSAQQRCCIGPHHLSDVGDNDRGTVDGGCSGCCRGGAGRVWNPERLETEHGLDRLLAAEGAQSFTIAKRQRQDLILWTGAMAYLGATQDDDAMGRNKRLAKMTPYRVVSRATDMPSPNWAGSDRLPNMLMSPTTVPTMPMVGA
jgi:hypothetical protein